MFFLLEFCLFDAVNCPRSGNFMKFCEGVGDSEICKILLLLVCFDHNFGDFRVTGWIFQDVLVDPKL